MTITLDHIQLAMPQGAENRMRAFYCDLLGLAEVPKPAPLAGRGGFWATAAGHKVHFGVDPDFRPATKAHPAFRVKDIAALAATLANAGHAVHWDTAWPDITRFFTSDPVGNRVELIAGE